MQKDKIRIGCGAGFSGDRLEPALVLCEKGNLDYLILECLAERTIALAQLRKKKDPTSGYDLLLERRLGPLLPVLVKNQTKLITNMGAANPIEAGRKIIELARNLGLKIKVAVVGGDEVLHLMDAAMPVLESGQTLSDYSPLTSANAYLGIEAILPALASGADIVITGRVADPSLFLAPMVHEFRWSQDDFELMGKGTVIGHLLECAGQITGGYFADPVSKPVPDMHVLGHPFAEIHRDGSATISKIEGTGGLINSRTAKEQLLYEVLDPFNYLTPDVNANFSRVEIEEISLNLISIRGGSGQQKPANLKVSVGFAGGYIGEGEISYAGANAKERALLAGEIIQKRIGVLFEEFKIDLMGINSLHGDNLRIDSNPYEVRLRVVGKSNREELANLVGEEVEALYTNGPAGGGGARKFTKEVIGVVSVLLDRKLVSPILTVLES
jgi:hypothetical protein